MTEKRGLAMGVLIFASFMDLLDATIVNVALPSIRSDLDASGAQLEWAVGGYLLAFAVLMITGGRLGDMFGRRRLFVTGVIGFTVGSALACVAPTIGVLLVARVVQGGFAAMMVPQVLSSLQALYAPRERAAMLGVIGAVSGMSAVIGPVLGGWLVSSDAFGIGWRSIFLINLPVGVVLVALALRWVPDTRSEHPLRLDPVGLVLVTTGLLGVVYALIEGRQQDWAAWILAVGAGGLLVLAAFVVQQVRRERTTGSALLPMRLFADRGFSAGLVTQGAFQGALAGFALVLTVYVQTGLGWSAVHAGLTLLPFSLGAFVGSGVSVPLGMKLGKVVMVAGAVLQSVATVWVLAMVHGQGDGLSTWDLDSGAGRLRGRPRAPGGAAGRRRAGDHPDRRGGGRVGHLRNCPAGRGRTRGGDHRDRVLRRRRHVVRRGLTAVRTDRRVLGGGRGLRALRGGQPAVALPEPGARAPGGRGCRAGRGAGRRLTTLTRQKMPPKTC